MCGICGFYGFEDINVLKKMVKILAHRGPDDNGFYVDENISLGHTRLSIIDLSEKGRQPMSNEDGTIWIVYNGETYNFMELRKELEAKHSFYSNTDTEVLIHAYEEYGLDFIKKLRGMFAFALYDSKKKKLVLARDPIGKKPLYYYWDGERFIFASEIKAILEAGIKREIDTDGLSAYLTYQYTIGQKTMFKGIKKVLGGNMLIFNFNFNNKKTEIRRYWDIKEDILQETEEYFITRLRELLEESARLRLIADVPVGAFLSGGLDSSTIVALARPYVDYDFHTFSVGFGDIFSELGYARTVAEHLDTVHHEIVIEPTDVIKELKKIAWHYDEPLGETGTIANYFLSKEARKYVKVVLAGEAGDELFGGYANYKINSKVYNYYRLPKLFRDALKGAVSLVPWKGNPFRNRVEFYLNYAAQRNFDMAHLYTTKVAGMNEDELEWFSSGDLRFNDNLIVNPDGVKHPFNRMLALDCKNMLPEKFLMKADKATMANSVEERLLLMDKEIVEFAFTIPPKFKIVNGCEKYILKKSVRDLLPKEIIARKKQPFGVPYTYWIKNELFEFAEQKIEEGELINKVFDGDKCKRLMEGIKKIEDSQLKIGSWNHPYHQLSLAWNLFALEVWYERVFIS
jgi:asparagine synthase (glutamine-hydrolysing)